LNVDVVGATFVVDRAVPLPCAVLVAKGDVDVALFAATIFSPPPDKSIVAVEETFRNVS
jgi:hypothetical protein